MKNQPKDWTKYSIYKKVFLPKLLQWAPGEESAVKEGLTKRNLIFLSIWTKSSGVKYFSDETGRFVSVSWAPSVCRVEKSVVHTLIPSPSRHLSSNTDTYWWRLFLQLTHIIHSIMTQGSLLSTSLITRIVSRPYLPVLVIVE